MRRQHVAIAVVEGRRGCPVRRKHFRPLAAEQVFEHRHGDKDTIAIAGETCASMIGRVCGAGETLR